MSASDTDILQDASKNGKLEIIRKHVENGGDPEMPEKRGRTLLHTAAVKGNLEVVEYLVEEAKVNVEARDVFERTPLYMACKEWQLGVVKYLASHRKVDLNCQDYVGNTPLHIVAGAENIYLIKALLEVDDRSQRLEAKRIVNPEIANTRGDTPLHLVADVKSAQLILKSQPPSRILELINIENLKGQTPMEAAKNSIEIIDSKRKKKAKAKLVEYFAAFKSQPLFAVESEEKKINEIGIAPSNETETVANPQFNKFQRSFALQLRQQLYGMEIHCVAPIVMSFLSLEDVMNYHEAF